MESLLEFFRLYVGAQPQSAPETVGELLSALESAKSSVTGTHLYSTVSRCIGAVCTVYQYIASLSDHSDAIPALQLPTFPSDHTSTGRRQRAWTGTVRVHATVTVPVPRHTRTLSHTCILSFSHLPHTPHSPPSPHPTARRTPTPAPHVSGSTFLFRFRGRTFQCIHTIESLATCTYYCPGSGSGAHSMDRTIR